jgi:hypothetical protein
MRGHNRPKDGVASLAYDPRIHPAIKAFFLHDGSPGQARR